MYYQEENRGECPAMNLNSIIIVDYKTICINGVLSSHCYRLIIDISC